MISGGPVAGRWTQGRSEEVSNDGGQGKSEDLTLDSGLLTSRQVLVTRTEVVGKSLGELHERYPVELKATRLTRAGLQYEHLSEFAPQVRRCVVAGGKQRESGPGGASSGNSIKELNLVRLVTLFLGMALGVLVGCYPFTVGNMPAPLRLGLAGGPLLTAIILSCIGCTGPLLWYLPTNANLLLREFGIVLFLSCVGPSPERILWKHSARLGLPVDRHGC